MFAWDFSLLLVQPFGMVFFLLYAYMWARLSSTPSVVIYICVLTFIFLLGFWQNSNMPRPGNCDQSCTRQWAGLHHT
jgi:MFS-type transporter involved in bile tolerance (Atg22 family)